MLLIVFSSYVSAGKFCWDNLSKESLDRLDNNTTKDHVLEPSSIAEGFKSFHEDHNEFIAKKLNSFKQRDNESYLSYISRLATWGGVRVMFAPTFLMLDLFKLPFKALRPPGKGVDENIFGFFYLPYDIGRRNALEMSAYLGVVASGYSLTQLDLKNDVGINEMLDKGHLDLGDDEIMVIVESNDKALGSLAKNMIKKKYEEILGQKMYQEKVHIVSANNNNELIEKLPKLREHGRIKNFMILSHGSPGNLHLYSGYSMVSGDDIRSFDINALKEKEDEIRKFPVDLFSQDAQLTLISCDIGTGEEGEKFVKEFGATFFRNGGTVYAASEKVYVTNQDEIAKHVGIDKLISGNDYERATFINDHISQSMVLLKFGLELVNGTLFEPRIKEIKIPAQSN